MIGVVVSVALCVLVLIGAFVYWRKYVALPESAFPSLGGGWAKLPTLWGQKDIDESSTHSQRGAAEMVGLGFTHSPLDHSTHSTASFITENSTSPSNLTGTEAGAGTGAAGSVRSTFLETAAGFLGFAREAPKKLFAEINVGKKSSYSKANNDEIDFR